MSSVKGLILEPMIADENVIVQFTDDVVADKNTALKVPNGFVAIVFIDEQVSFKVNVCIDKRLLGYGKDYVGKQCKVAFVRTKLLPQMAWGFGNIQVNNNRLKEAYRVGANGRYSIEITDVSKLIRAFYTESNITIDMIRDKTINVLRTIGISILSGYFADTQVSVFEIASHTNELRSIMQKALLQERAFTELGVKLSDITVEGIHVNEDDIELIRNRINR